MIEVLKHVRIDIPTIAKTSIEFYGTMGFIMYFIIMGFALFGLFILWYMVIKKLAFFGVE